MGDEILTLQEFTDRLKIGRSTLFVWLRQGVLLPGKHFIKVGRVLRFIWSEDILTALAEATVKPSQPLKQKPSSRSSKPVINWEY